MSGAEYVPLRVREQLFQTRCCVCVCVCVDSIQRAMCQAFSVPPGSECRLWMKSSDSSCERLRNVHMSVLDACLSSGMVSMTLQS